MYVYIYMQCWELSSLSYLAKKYFLLDSIYLNIIIDAFFNYQDK